MPEYNENLDDLMKELEGASITTSRGSFLKVETIKSILERRAKETAEAAQKPQPKTMRGAKLAAANDPQLKESFVRGPREAGRSIPADS